MKNTIVTISVLLGLLLLPLISYGQSADVVYMRINENVFANNVNSFIQVTFSDGKIEYIELEKIKQNGSGAEKNGQLIAMQIKKLLEMGYSLKSQSSGGAEVFHTIMVFLKD